MKIRFGTIIIEYRFNSYLGKRVFAVYRLVNPVYSQCLKQKIYARKYIIG